MAAALAARISGASVLNVCDLPLSTDDGLAPPPPSPPTTSDTAELTGDALLGRLLESVAGCGARRASPR